MIKLPFGKLWQIATLCYTSGHVMPALVHLSARLASVRTHSTLAHDLLYTDLNFRVRLSRAIDYSFALHVSISILYRITIMWLLLGRHNNVSLLSLLRSASVREDVIHEHQKGRILIQDTRPHVSGLRTGEQENLNFFNS